MEKTFTVAGTSVLKGETTVRFANDIGRVKVLEKNEHTAVQLIELGSAMTREDALRFLEAHADFKTPEQVAAIQLALNPPAKPEKPAKEPKAAAEPKAPRTPRKKAAAVAAEAAGQTATVPEAPAEEDASPRPDEGYVEPKDEAVQVQMTRLAAEGEYDNAAELEAAARAVLEEN